MNKLKHNSRLEVEKGRKRGEWFAYIDRIREDMVLFVCLLVCFLSFTGIIESVECKSYVLPWKVKVKKETKRLLSKD